jgi:hypothetical protein
MCRQMGISLGGKIMNIYLSKKQNKVLETILKKELKDGQADWLVDGERDWSVVSAILEKLKGEK